MSERFEPGQGRPGEVFVEEKFHFTASGHGGFHGRQPTGKFEAGAYVRLGQGGIVLQNLPG